LHHVETTGRIGLKSLSVAGKNRDFGVWYEPISPVVLRHLLRQIDVGRYPQFVDYGSGKGRSLLIASEFPFRSIRGVEFSPELHEVALRNIKSYSHPARICPDIESHLGDAAEFAPQEVPTLHFFYSPFRQSVMQAVCDNISQSLSSNPRDSLIVFYGLHPDTIAVIDALGWPRKEIRVPRDYGASGRYRALLYTFSPRAAMARQAPLTD